MKTYEYKVLKYRSSWTASKERDIEALIEPYARDGWRVVSTSSMNQGNDLFIFLERER